MCGLLGADQVGVTAMPRDVEALGRLSGYFVELFQQEVGDQSLKHNNAPRSSSNLDT